MIRSVETLLVRTPESCSHRARQGACVYVRTAFVIQCCSNLHNKLLLKFHAQMLPTRCRRHQRVALMHNSHNNHIFRLLCCINATRLHVIYSRDCIRRPIVCMHCLMTSWALLIQMPQLLICRTPWPERQHLHHVPQLSPPIIIIRVAELNAIIALCWRMIRCVLVPCTGR